MPTVDKDAVKRANPIEGVVAELLNEQGRPRSGGELAFRCPWHDDTRPSLNVNPTKNGGVYQCRVCGDAKGDVFSFVMKYRGVPFTEALEWLAQRGLVTATQTTERSSPAPRHARPSRIRPEEIEREHLYRRDGVVVARKVLLRERDADGKKQMCWQRPDGAGGWIDGLGGVDPCLYGLDEAVALKGAGGLIWCEGERDAAALLALGVPAVSSQHGAAGKVLPSHVEAVVSAGFTRVHVIGDRHAGGKVYNENVPRMLHAAGLTDARPVPWESDRPEGFDAQHPVDGKTRLIQRCQQAAPCVAPSAPPNEIRESLDRARTFEPEAVLINMQDVQVEPVEWLWTRRIARGKLQHWIGDPGIGKSFLTLDVAARISTGRPFPDGEPTPVGSVIFLAAEDGLGDTMKPRLAACGAEMSRISVLQAVRIGEGDHAQRGFSLEHDIGILEQAIVQTGAVLVVIDPVTSYLAARRIATTILRSDGFSCRWWSSRSEPESRC